MATTSRRQVLDGRPGIPAALDMPSTRAAIDQIRTRLEKLDAAVNRSFSTLDASSPQKALESLQTQIAVLSKELDNLTAQVEDAIGERQPTYLAMQMGDDGEDGHVGPPGPPGPAGSTVMMDFSEYCGEDQPLGFNLPTTSSGAVSFDDLVMYDSTGRAMLTGDGRAILVGE